MKENIESVIPIKEKAKEYAISPWDIDINTINIEEYSFVAGANYVIKIIEEEVGHHDCPEHSYFCECLYELFEKLKGDKI